MNRPKLFLWKRILIFFLCFFLLFSQFLSFSVKPVFAAQTYDMATVTNYNLRYDGAASGDGLFTSFVKVADLDGGNKQDIIIGAYMADNNSRTNSGSLYVIYGTLLDDWYKQSYRFGRIFELQLEIRWCGGGRLPF